MRALRVHGPKPTSRNTFIVNLFALERENESKYDQKTFSWEFLRGFHLSLNP